MLGFMQTGRESVHGGHRWRWWWPGTKAAAALTHVWHELEASHAERMRVEQQALAERERARARAVEMVSWMAR